VHDDEQDTRATGSVPNAFGNALAWRWSREMPRALKPGLLTLLYVLRAMANASGELRFHGDRTPIRIQDIAKAAGADEKDTRERLEAARLAGVVTIIGERRRGRPVLYAILPAPRPDWAAAAAYLDGAKQRREDARQARAARKGTERKAAPWAQDEAEEFGGRSPELPGAEFGGPPPELAASTADRVRGTVPRPSSGDRPPTGSGDRPPTNPGSTHVSTQGMAGLGGQPQDARAREALEEPPGAAAAPTLRPVPSPPGGRGPHSAEQGSSSQRPLLLPVRSLQQVSREELDALRAAATPEEIRQAIAELGATQAMSVYGHRLVAPHLASLPDHETGT
jgi:hypothetical protein